MKLESTEYVKLGEEFVIYHEQDRDCVPPDVLNLKDGTIAVTFRSGKDHASAEGEIVWAVSRDSGATWSQPQVIKKASEPAVGYRDPSLTELSDGTLLLSFFRASGTAGDGSWDGSHLIVMRSFDSGETWPEETAIPTEPFDFMRTTERCIELASGRVLMPIYAGSYKNQYCVSGILCSDDQGATWSYLSTIDARAFNATYRYYMENSIVEMSGGKLIAVSRTDQHMLQAISEDSGVTWKEQKVLTDTPPETQPSLLKLSNNTLLLAYGDRGPLPRDLSYPVHIRVRVSRDEGDSWEEGFVLEDQFAHWDMGYPTSIELCPSEVLTVYWRSEPDPEQPWPKNWQYWLCGKKWSWRD
jgi:hypothetical protein